MNPLCKRRCTMRQALEDPDIYGRLLPGETWAAWRTILIASQGEPLTAAERETFRELTGREREPDEPVDELWNICGRRGGKTRAAAVLGSYFGSLVDYSAIQAPGERIKVPTMAAAVKQARKAYSYLLGIYNDQSGMFFPEMDGEPTQEEIRTLQGVDLEVRVADYRTIRGETMGAAICDEVALWRLEGSANADEEILNAIRPGLDTTGGPLIVLTSPYARRGEVWRHFQQHYGPEGDPRILVVQAPSLRMNPTLNPARIERARKADPAKAAAEYDAQFRKDVEAFVTLEAVRACMAGDLTERAPADSTRYVAFTDPSGGGADAMTLAIAHEEDGKAVLDAVRERPAGDSPDAVVQEFAALLKRYGVSEVTGDNYAGEWPKERFRTHGIAYHKSDLNKSEIYLEFLPLLNSVSVLLLDVPRLEAQLVSLERKTSRGTGRDIIDHPKSKRAHDDVANAVCGALVLASKAAPKPLTISDHVLQRAHDRFRPQSGLARAGNPFKSAYGVKLNGF